MSKRKPVMTGGCQCRGLPMSFGCAIMFVT